MKKLFPLLGLLVLFGFGCRTQSSNNGSTPSSTSNVPPIESGNSSSTSTLFPIDVSWKTYSNKALGFQFQTPTKGGYTPTWEVKLYRTNTENPISDLDGCFISKDNANEDLKEYLKIQDTSFCQTQYSDNGAGNRYLTDYFVTKKGDYYIVITFTKHLVSAGALNCSFVSTYPYSLNSKSCVPFKPDDYQTLLKTILSTFVYTEKL